MLFNFLQCLENETPCVPTFSPMLSNRLPIISYPHLNIISLLIIIIIIIIILIIISQKSVRTHATPKLSTPKTLAFTTHKSWNPNFQ